MSKLGRSKIGSGTGLLVMLVAGLSGLALVNAPADCRQQLLTAYHKLAGKGTDNRNVFHAQFVSTTLYQVQGQRAKRETTLRGELYTQGDKVFFQTDDMNLWQDGHYVATTLRSQRAVLLTRMVPKQAATDPRRMLIVRDTLLKIGKLQLCASEQQGKQLLQHVQLGYSDALAIRLKIRNLDFWLTPQNTLQQLRVQYLPGNEVQQVTTRFTVQERLLTSDKLPIDARLQVLNEQGKLLPAYQGYRLVNQITPGR
ncbi:MAG: hypothetical protein EOO61_00790 [Hymenobacter sp.]|nr:MAG: hypothetical protein EOO61_00790 [Hymenobacter sp.]